VSKSRLLYPRKEAAYQLGISVRSLDYLVSSKKIRCQKIGRRTLFHHKELERFASANHYGTVADAPTKGAGHY
jgi:excisionase family DNA binding protein